MRSSKFQHIAKSFLAAGAILVTGILPAGAASTSTEARPQVTCYGDYCSGQDPEETGCAADAITVDWVDLESARLDLRWSPTCKTNWARYEQYPRGWYFGEHAIELRAVQDTGYTQRNNNDVEGLSEGTHWTPMIYSPVRLVKAEVVFSPQTASFGEMFVGAMLGEYTASTEMR